MGILVDACGKKQARYMGRFEPYNVSEALKQIEVNRGAPLLENTTIGLRSDTRSRARVSALLTAISL